MLHMANGVAGCVFTWWCVCPHTLTALLPACLSCRVLPVPAGHESSSESCAPEGTAFALPASLQGRALVLQAHWRLPSSLTDAAVVLPALQLRLGATSAPAPAPALLGSFIGSGVYPPSSLSKSLQAFSVPVPAATAGTAGAASSTATARLACGKRCTYRPLGRLSPKPVNLVSYSFTTFDRATAVTLEVQRGAAGRAAGAVKVASSPGGGVVAFAEPFKVGQAE